VPFDEEFARQMEAAREVMRENRDVLRSSLSDGADLDPAGDGSGHARRTSDLARETGGTAHSPKSNLPIGLIDLPNPSKFKTVSGRKRCPHLNLILPVFIWH
jgi:hypothetical protein